LALERYKKGKKVANGGEGYRRGLICLRSLQRLISDIKNDRFTITYRGKLIS